MSDVYIVEVYVYQDEMGGMVVQNFISDHRMTRYECAELAENLKRECYQDAPVVIRVSCTGRPACLVSDMMNRR